MGHLCCQDQAPLGTLSSLESQSLTPVPAPPKLPQWGPPALQHLLLCTACRPAAPAARVVDELQAQLTAVHRERSAPCRACRVHYSVSSCATCLRATALSPCSFLLHCSAACCICLSAFLQKAMALEDRLALPSWRQDAQRSWRLHNEAGTQSYGPRRNAGKGRLWCVQEQGGGQTWHGEQTVLQTTAVEEVSESRGAKREGHG